MPDVGTFSDSSTTDPFSWWEEGSDDRKGLSINGSRGPTSGSGQQLGPPSRGTVVRRMHTGTLPRSFSPDATHHAYVEVTISQYPAQSTDPRLVWLPVCDVLDAYA